MAVAAVCLGVLGAEAMGSVVFVYDFNATAAGEFKSFLDGRGYPTTLLPMASVVGTDLSAFNTIIIGDDTGNLDEWGTAAITAAISGAGRPIIGVGEGGYAFFGKLSMQIGWPNGWHWPGRYITAVEPEDALYHTPNEIPIPAGSANRGVRVGGEHGEDLSDRAGGRGECAGLDFTDADHYDIVLQGEDALWGFSGSPALMTDVGRDLFENLLHEAPEPGTIVLMVVGGLGLRGGGRGFKGEEFKGGPDGSPFFFVRGGGGPRRREEAVDWERKTGGDVWPGQRR